MNALNEARLLLMAGTRDIDQSAVEAVAAQAWALIALAEAQAELAKAQREAMAAGLALLELAKSRM